MIQSSRAWPAAQLQRAMQRVAASHEALRLVLSNSAGRPIEAEEEPAALRLRLLAQIEIPLSEVDVSGAADEVAAARQHMRQVRRTRFDLSGGLPWTLQQVRTGRHGVFWQFCCSRLILDDGAASAIQAALLDTCAQLSSWPSLNRHSASAGPPHGEGLPAFFALNQHFQAYALDLPEPGRNAAPPASAQLREQLLTQSNGRQSDLAPGGCLHELFERQAERAPEAVAVEQDGNALTYRELNVQANRLAHHLRTVGVAPDRFVAICARRSLAMVVGMLAVLKAGGAYVPLDPAYPQEGLNAILRDSEPVAVLAQADLCAGLDCGGAALLALDGGPAPWAGEAEHNPGAAPGLAPQHLAYLVYTSGSTGVPKGVMVPHRAIVNEVLALGRLHGLAVGRRQLQFVSTAFDVCVEDVFSTLASGATLVLRSEAWLGDAANFWRLCAEQRISGMNLPALFWEQLALDTGAEIPACVRRVVVGGEAMGKAALRAWFDRRGHRPELYNAYGPSETSVCASVQPCADRGDAAQPIGRPIDNTCMYLLDQAGQPVAPGATGEIHIGGIGVASGYLNQPELTRARFLADPFSDQPEARMYRTGDLGRRLADGTVEFIGRTDQQIKIRGFRIEPGEIEAHLLDQPGVREATVLAREDQPGDKRLVAYLVAQPGQTAPHAPALRAALARVLPDYMLPAAYVTLGALPLTPNGKLDRAALPAPAADAYAQRPYQAPQGDSEQALAQIWAALLRVDRVGRQDNFFELGGHSLLALQMISRLRQRLGVEVTLQELFDQPVLRDFAAVAAGAAASALHALVPLARPATIPLSFAQQRLWLVAQMGRQASAAYHLPGGLRLTGRLDQAALGAALARIVQRHEVLRLYIGQADGEPCQCFTPQADLPLHSHDLRAAHDPKAALAHWRQVEAQAPFDLAAGALIRARLLRTGEQEHVLLLTMHHIVADGWSMGVLADELAQLYRAYALEGVAYGDDPLAPLAVQYADYTLWQRQWLGGALQQEQQAYWQRQLAGAPALNGLPTDRPRPPVQDFGGDSVAVRFDAGLGDALRALSRRHGTTLYMTMLAGWAALLARLSGQDELVVGTPVANRRSSELEPLIGFFVNTLALRLDLAGDPSVADWLARVRQRVLEAQRHQDLPFEQVVEVLKPERTPAHHPLFQLMFAWQNAPGAAPALQGLALAALPEQGGQGTQFDFALSLREEADGAISGTLSYATALFERDSVERHLGHLQALLRGMAADDSQQVERIDLLSEQQRRQLLVEWNATRPLAAPALCLHQLVELQCARAPDAVAVEQDGRQLSYRELNQQANRLAHHLRTVGVAPDRMVAICALRSPAMVVGMLAVLKAGGAYVPLDPAYPPERLNAILRDSEPVAVLSQGDLCDGLDCGGAVMLALDASPAPWAVEPAANPDEFAGAAPHHLAYLVYTSGSTGLPKGVMVPHRAIVNEVLALGELHGLCAGRRQLQFVSTAFDVCVEDVFSTLASCATLVLRSEAWLGDAANFWRHCREQRISGVNLPAQFWEQLALDQRAAIPPCVTRIVVGGEVMGAGALRAWFGREGHRPELFNAYGPSETAVCASVQQCSDRGGAAEPIGRPVANTRMYLLDRHGQLVPPGVAGEIHIGGAGVASGYLNQPELTRERFVADPFSTAPLARMYRTGDIGRWLADGTVEFIGRNDQQVKIRGFRIEPGEIEARLDRLPGVAKSAVLAREDRPGEKRLVAYLAVPPGQPAPPVQELRQALTQALPDYMVPAAYVTLAALPLTPNGKLDRQALPAPAADAYAQHAYQAPQGPLEQCLAQIWAELLRAERVGRQDHFFELGGHSLLAVQMTARLRQRLGVEVALQELFARPLLCDFAAVVAQAAASALPPLVRGPRPATIPLSFAQQRLWFVAQLGAQASAAYHIPGGLRLRGQLDEAALAAALARIVQRHEVLRTRIELVDGEPCQRILAQAAPLLQRHDISANPDPADPTAALAHWRELEAQTPFDLAAGPLLRARLLRLAAQEHVLLLTMHHIVADGWSMGVLADELAQLYRAYAQDGLPTDADPLAPLPVQYADYTLWQRQWLGGALQQEQLAYWQRQLAGAPALNGLPTDRPRPPVQDFGGDSVAVRFDAELGDALRALSQRHGTTLYMTLLAGWAALLARLSGQDELVIGTPVANRRSSELEPLIGFFVNTLALRLDLAGDPSVADWLAQVRQRVLEAQSHQDLPFEQVVELLKPERTLAHHPLFQLMFVWQNAAQAAPALAGLQLEALAEQGGHGTQFDFALSLREEADGAISGMFSYATALFERDSVERHLAYLQVLLRGMAADDGQQVDRIDLLSEQQRRQLLVEWNVTRPLAAPALCLHQLVELQCARSPDAVAVEQDGRQLSYRELNEQANRLAHHLRTVGVAPDQMVAICALRGPAMVVGMLAVLKAGGAYVPLDPAYPAERLNAILRDSEPVAVLTQGALCDGLDCGGAVMLALDASPAPWAARPAANPGDIAGVAGAAPHHLAYLVYTSGSTGLPKGVMVPHRAIVNEVLALGELHGLCAGRRQLQFVSTAFDVCAEDVFSTLASGATLVLRSDAWLGDAANFWRHCREQRISGMNLPALFWEQLALDRRAAIPPCVRRIAVGGEVMGAGALRSWFGREGYRPELFNAYGPSETAVCASVQQCSDRGGAAEPIGRPIANTQMYLLNRHGQLVPPGVAGEIHIGGAGVASGYLNQPELTRERFVADPFSTAPQARMYRTGDIGRWLADGTVEFIGRNDQQVKIRGFRIEPGEIEVQLSRLPGVGEASVVPREDRPGNKYLVAYVVAQPGQPAPAAHDLRQALAHVLPEHMVPAAYVALAALPLTPNGKLDRAALPAPEADAYARHDYQAPQGAAEGAVAQLWTELLHVERVGRLDSFFALGGHSLLAVQMTARLRQRLGVEVALQQVFAEPVLQDFARVVEQAAASVLPALLPGARPDTIPLSFAQQRLWFVAQMGEQASAAYHISGGLRLRGRLDEAALAAALERIVQRHEVLRTRFELVDGEPCQRIAAPDAAAAPTLVRHALDGCADGAAELAHWREREARTPFDLARGPLLRARLLRLAAQEHVLLLTMHHIVSDGWSMGVLAGELAALYRAYALDGVPHGVDPLAPLAVQYADYTLWQRRWLGGALQHEQLAYWQRQLAGAPALNGLPTDRPRSAVQEFGGDSVAVRLEPELGDALRALSRRHGTTLYMTLLAAWAALLARWSGQDEVVIGSPVANRRNAEVEPLIGFFVNTLALRLDLAGDPSVGAWLARVRQRVLDAQSHQDVPFEQVVEVLKPQRSLAHHPVFQLMFAWQNTPGAAPVLDGLTLEALPEDGAHGTQFELTLNLHEEADGGIAGVLGYASAVYERATVQRQAAALRRMLAGMARDDAQAMERIELLDDEQRHQLLAAWNDAPRAAGPAVCIHQLFERQVLRTPTAVAAEQDGRHLTYRQMNAQANRLAHRLAADGVRPGAAVAVLLPRSMLLVVAQLAVLKCGAFYVPLDLDAPLERQAALIGDCGAAVVLTSRQRTLPPAAGWRRLDLDATPGAGQGVAEVDAPNWHAAWPARNPDLKVDAEATAYVMYTSGSTGQPKGVMVPHRAIARVAVDNGYAAFDGSDRVAFAANPAFDAATMDVWAALLNGGRLVVVDAATLLAPERLARLLKERRITAMFLTTALFNQYARAIPEALAGLRYLMCGGERADPAAFARLLAQGGPQHLVHCYGPTETTTFATTCEIATGFDLAAPLPIGRPIADTSIYLLDRFGQLVPPGAVGEIHIGGAGVAKGYLNRPELSAERFIADPFTGPSGPSGARMYRTGDLGRWLADGRLEFLGRNDQQVKIRGFRIEPGEIEAQLDGLPGVAKSAVLAREDWPGEKRLVAYIATAPERPAPAAQALRQALSQLLPEYMVPAAYVMLEALPLTPNGKLDRKALPAPEADAYAQRAYQPPQGSVEQALAQIWGGLLQIDRVGREDHFFELGGHSLLAVQMTARLRQRLGVEVALQEVFAQPVLHQFARVVEQAAASALPPLLPAARPATIPLSFAQQRLWFVAQMGDQASAAYHIPGGLRLCGRLDEAALAAALARIVQRHEALRTRFELVDGGPCQRIAAPAAPAAPALIRHALDDCADSAAELAHWRAQEARAPFDLATGPLLRTRLLRLAAQEHVLLLTMHHIVSDGWSMGVLAGELAALYRAYALDGVPYGVDPLAPLAVQYADYSLWQRQWLGGALQQEQLAYWLRRLAGAPALHCLPTDRPRPAVQDFGGDSLAVRFEPELADVLRALSQRHGSTLYMTLLAAWAALLVRWSGQDEVVIGSPVANRRNAEVEPLIGFFVNTLALRLELGGEPTVGDWLATVRQRVLEAQGHQDVPFEQVVEALKPQRSLAHHPLFQLMFAWQNTPGEAPVLDGLTLEALPEDGAHGSQFELTLSLHEAADGGIAGVLGYATALYDRATVERHLASLHRMLAGMGSDDTQAVERIDLLDEAQRRQLLVAWSDAPRAAGPAVCIHQLFERQALRTPLAVAVERDEHRLSYQQVNERANRLAHRLAADGVRPGAAVAVLLPRSMLLVVAQLAVLKCGAFYVPLDLDVPLERQAALIADCGAAVVLTSRQRRLPPAAGWRRLDLDATPGAGQGVAEVDAPNWHAAWPARNPDLKVDAEATAYVMYTSGSTGQPKGVMVPHRAIARVAVDNGYAAFDSSDRVAFAANPAFDAATMDVWAALLNGGRLVVVDAATLLAPERLARLLKERRITAMFLTTALFNQYARAIPEALAGLRYLMCGGERADPAAFARLLAQGGPQHLVHCYGPTETTTFATTCEIGAGFDVAAPLPIGRPIADTSIYLLDRFGQLVPPGAVGEIHIGGAGVAKGYLNRPELSAERFVADRFAGPCHSDPSGARMYRTGDLGRWLADGRLEFLGRNDQQVKIRGFRIEPGEIEAQLDGLPGVAKSAVLAREDRPGEKRLVAYIATAPEQPAPAAPALRQALAQLLPEYMVPAAYVMLEALPLTPNGKLDRKALPAPDADAYAQRAYQPPQGPVEEALARIWIELLQLERVGRRDNFFELGGHSLLVVRMIEAMRAVGLELDVQTIFRAPTIEAIAGEARAQEQTNVLLARHLVPIAAGDKASRPLFFIHEPTGQVLSYTKVSRYLDMPVYGVQAVRDDVDQAPSVETLARRYVDVVRAVQAKGPYRLCGWSGGGIFAYELARQLLAEGEAVEFLGMIDSTHPQHVAPIPPFTEEQRQWQFLKLHTHYLDHDLDENAVGVLDRLGSLDAAVAHCRQAGWLPPGFTVEELAWRTAMFTQFGAACVAYRPPPLPMPVHLFTAEVAPGKDPSMGWSEVAGAMLRLVLIGGDHFTIVEEPLAGRLGAAIGAALANAPHRPWSAVDAALLAGRKPGGSSSRT